MTHSRLLALVLLAAFPLAAGAKPPHPAPTPSPSPVQRVDTAALYASLWAQWRAQVKALADKAEQLDVQLTKSTKDLAQAIADTAKLKIDIQNWTAWGLEQERKKNEAWAKYNEAKVSLEKARHQLIYLRIIICIVLGGIAGVFGIRLVSLVAPFLGPYAALAALTPVALGLLVAAGVYFGLMALP